MKGCLWEEQRVKTSGNATEGAVWIEQEKFLPCDDEMVRKVLHILLKQGQLQAQRCRKISDKGLCYFQKIEFFYETQYLGFDFFY